MAIAEAFNQINRYSRESFWAASGLFEYVQLFIISNGTHTKYYSNTVRSEHIKEASEGAVKKGKRSSNSFEFTSWWADATNRPITDLIDFGKTFFCQARTFKYLDQVLRVHYRSSTFGNATVIR